MTPKFKTFEEFYNRSSFSVYGYNKHNLEKAWEIASELKQSEVDELQKENEELKKKIEELQKGKPEYQWSDDS